MARISTYSQDPNLEGADRVIGSDASQANATMNFSLNSLGDFYTKSGLADATRLGYRFRVNTGDPIGGIALDNTDPALVTSIDIGIEDISGLSTSVLNSLLVMDVSRIKLVSARQGVEPAQAFYMVGDISENLDGTTLIGWNIPVTIIPEAHSGTFNFGIGSNADDTLILIPLPANAGDGTGTGTMMGNAYTTIDVNQFGDADNIRLEAGVSDTLTFEAGQNIVLTGSADPDEMTIAHADVTTTTGTGAAGAGQFVTSLNLDAAGHITSANYGTAVTSNFQVQGQTDIPAGGNILNAETYQYTLVDLNNSGIAASGVAWSLVSAPDNITIDSDGLLRNANTNNSEATFTVRATYNTGGDNVNADLAVTKFTPWYYNQTVENAVTPPQNSFQTGSTRLIDRLNRGDEIMIPANANANALVHIQLPTTLTNPVFSSGIQIVTPLTTNPQTVTGIIGAVGYTQYTFGQSQNLPLTITIS